MLFGNRFYSPPPFEVLDELSYGHLTEREIEDLNKVKSMFYEEGNPSGQKIRQIVNKYPTETQFKMQWALLLGTNTKYTEADKLLKECLADPAEELSVKCALGALYRISDQKEKAERMVQDIIRNVNDPKPRPLYLNHFEQLCLFLTQYFLDTDQFEKALEIYQWTITDKFYDLNLSLSKIVSAYYVTQAKDGNFVYQPPEETYYAPSLYQKLRELKIDESKINSITQELMEIIYEEIDEQVFKGIEAIPDKANDFAWLLRESLLKAEDTCDGEPIVHALTGMAHFGLNELLPVALDLLGQERDLVHNFVGYAFEDIFAPCLHPFVKDHYELFEAFLLRKDADGLNQSIIMNMLCYKGLDDSEIRKKAINLFRRLLDRYQKENDIFRLSWLTSTLSLFRYTEFEEEVVKIWKTGILDEEILLGDLYADDEIYVLMPYPVFETLSGFYEFYQEKNIWYDLNDKEFDGNPDANILSCIMHNAILSLHLGDDEFDEDIYDDEDLPFLDEYDETFIPEQFKRSGEKIGRNDPCPCGSGLKYKKCCLPKLMN